MTRLLHLCLFSTLIVCTWADSDYLDDDVILVGKVIKDSYDDQTADGTDESGIDDIFYSAETDESPSAPCPCASWSSASSSASSSVSFSPSEKLCADQPNQVFNKEKPSCPPEICESLVKDYDCSKAPPPSQGCSCLPGYLRLKETSPCIPICDCPQIDDTSSYCQDPDPYCYGPNEEFILKKRSCPPEICKSLVSRYDCSKAPPPQPGCACKSGFLRLDLNSPCIPICDCPEIAQTSECLCPNPNEIFLPQKPSCPPETCRSLVAKYDCSKFPPPQPGCACKPGYKRLNENSPCIPICECPEISQTSECLCPNPNEIFLSQKPSCPPETCRSLVAKYDCSKFPPPQPGCACKPGYKRLNENSPCIPICDCPEIAQTSECLCPNPNEIFLPQKPSCPPETCRSLVTKYDCSKFPPPKPGCACKPGYKRLNENSPCIPICDCPEIAHTPQCLCTNPNEIFLPAKKSCPPETCTSLVAKYDCSKAPPPQPGCACKSGFLRLNLNSPCIPMCDCPQIAHTSRCLCPNPNEIFLPAKKSCPPETCRSLVTKYDCSKAPPPQPGCACKSGFLRPNLNSPCIPMCDCPEIAHTPRCLCPGPNEEYLAKKPPCPPQTCTSLVTEYNCCNAPPPKPGCACKPGYVRLTPNSPCIPACDCPQIANTPKCKCKGPNEVFLIKKPSCPPEICQALITSYICSYSPPPQPGCACKPGFIRLNFGSPCMPQCDCPQIANTPKCRCKGPNEVYLIKKPSAPQTCKSLVFGHDCPHLQPLTRGCYCKPGFVRQYPFSPCMPECDCPQIANTPRCRCKGPNEVYLFNKPSCPPETCKSLIHHYDCSHAPPPRPGCACKPGFVRLYPDTPCIPECDCPQIANTPKCTYKCLDPNEEFLLAKPSCPPETCFTLSASFDCSNAPPPQPGCACKDGFLRQTETSPCIPIDQC